MKILHCCLAAFYVDNFGYQENILPKLHMLQGNEVKIVASTETYLNKIELGLVLPGGYINENGIPVKRLPYKKYIPKFIARKIRVYSGLHEELDNFNPEIIFLHDCQFLSILTIIKYIKRNKGVKLIIDSHTDYINSAKSFFSFYFLHRIIYAFCAKKAEKYASIFWATLPLRQKFLKDVYGIKKEKIAFLPFGTDDSLYNKNDIPIIRENFRKKYRIDNTDFVVVSGGKIDKRKNILQLISSFSDVVTKHNLNTHKLLIFGEPSDDLREEFFNLINSSKNVVFISWVSSKMMYNVFLSSDLGFFPGTHSVLWEEAVGCGLPCVFFEWDGIKHVDVGGNAIFLKNSSISSITNVLENIIFDEKLFSNLNKSAKKNGPYNFSYSKIASRSINI